MVIRDIDKERRRLDLTQGKLCAAAKVHPATYTRLKHGRTSGTERTFMKLRTALAAASREAAE